MSKKSKETKTHWLPEGFLVKINGIPFRLCEKTKIEGHKRNFVIAELVKENKNLGN